MKVGVVDHGMGNLRSVARALDAAGADVRVSSDAAELGERDALCVPGQGIFGRCMANLDASPLGDLVRGWIAEGTRPYLGICLGMQILFEGSDENPDARGLGIFGGRSERLSGEVSVPHIGWNTVGHEYFYFDHSFAVQPADESVVTGWCEHGARFAASVRHGNVTGVQFHPEKSGRAGIALLREWVSS